MAVTTLITDLGTAKTSFDSGADAAALAARAIAAAGPIMDVDGCLNLCILKAQELKELITYMISGSAVAGGSAGIFRTGDTSNANNYALLNAIVGILK